MTILPWLLATACAIILSAPLQSQTRSFVPAEKSTAWKLDGTKFSGNIRAQLAFVETGLYKTEFFWG